MNEEEIEEEEEEALPCDCNPCMNGGTCYDEGSAYQCVCPNDVNGDHCENGKSCETYLFIYLYQTVPPGNHP